MYNLLSNSGASTNLEAIAGASISVLERGYKPDVIDGNSSGALIAPLLAMGRLDDLKHFALNYNVSDAFSIPPVNSKGKPTLKGVYRVATGEPSLGKMDNLIYTLMDAFSKTDFTHWRKNRKMPEIYIATVGYKSGKLFKTRLRDIEDYRTAINYIIASASIPLMAEYVRIGLELHYDGGLRTHTLAPYMQKKYKGKIKRHISVYSRPKDYKIIDNNDNPNTMDVMARSFQIQNMEISKDNQREEIAFRINNNLDLNDMVFMPHLLKNKTYDFGNNKEKFDIGYNTPNKLII